MKTIRSLSKSVKVYAWYSGAASFVMWPFGPEHRGGRPDVTSKIYAVAKETGRDIGEVAGEVCVYYLEAPYPSWSRLSMSSFFFQPMGLS